MVNLTIQATQELSDSKYLHVSIITDRQQVIVSTNNIKAFPVIGIYDDSHLRFWALIALISALRSSSVSPSCAAVLCACSIRE